jgi:hypothetical protein
MIALATGDIFFGKGGEFAFDLLRIFKTDLMAFTNVDFPASFSPKTTLRPGLKSTVRC